MSALSVLNTLRKHDVKVWLADDGLKFKAPKGVMNAELLNLLKSNKLALIEFFTQQALQQQKAQQAPMLPVPREQRLPLSFSQQALWFIDQLSETSNQYNVPVTIEMRGELDIAALQQAFSALIQRHEILRTCYASDEQGPKLAIQPVQEFPLPFINVAELATKERAQKQAITKAEISEAPFDLAEDLMLRGALVQTDAQQYSLYLCMHHIASDGGTLAVLTFELSALYTAFSQQEVNSLPAQSLQYADYAAWQRQWFEDEGEALLTFWQQQLQGIPEVHSIGLDFPRPHTQTFAGANVNSTVTRKQVAGLQDIARAENATLFMVLQAVFAGLLHRYSGEDDIVMGTPVANRERTELGQMAGLFANSVVLRSDFRESLTFTQLVQQSKRYLLEAFRHQEMPFEVLVDTLAPERNLAYSPLFQVLLVLQNNQGGELQLPNLTLNSFYQENNTAKFDISLIVREQGDELTLSWEYNTSLFLPERIAQLDRLFHHFVDSVIAQPEQAVAAIPLMSADEANVLLNTWSCREPNALENNAKSSVYQANVDTSFAMQFDAQALKMPSGIALSFPATQQQLTYAELAERSNRLAHWLVQEGAQRNDIIAVCLPRGIELFVVILGILKAGAAYAPVDSTLPDEVIVQRVTATSPMMVMVDASSALLLDAPVSPQTPRQAYRVIDMQSSAMRDALESQPYVALAREFSVNDLSYVLTTSGTTGKPKAIAMPHKSLNNLMVQLFNDIPASAKEHFASTPMKVLQFASIGFDMSFTEMMFSWLSGGELVLIERDTQLDVAAITRLIQDQQVSVLNLPYSFLQSLANYSVVEQLTLPSVQIVMSSAEQMKISDDIRRFFSANAQATLFNHYGPSETHVVTTLALTGEPDSWPNIPTIGCPIANVPCYVLDAQQQPVPVGVVGELYCGGVAPAEGYLHQPELTAEKFIADPFDGDSTRQMFRTGDLVRWTFNGELECLGRIDQQVKVRGFRIELAEIDTALLQFDAIAKAVTVLNDGAQQLVAYVTLHNAAAAKTEQAVFTELAAIKGKLADKLPAYMIPATLIPLASLPLTTNGKVDLRALPAPDLSEFSTQEYVAPATELEQRLVTIWQTLLTPASAQTPLKIGVTESFFEIGGHSLLATKLVSHIRAQFHVDFHIRDVFEQQTIQRMCGVIQSAARSDIPPIEPAQADALLVTSYAQQRLWLVDQIEQGSSQYNMPAAYRIRGSLNVLALQHALTQVVLRHQVLRTVFFQDEQGDVQQQLLSVTQVPLAQASLANLTGETQRSALADMMSVENTQRFDLANDLMLRATLVTLADEEYVLLVTMHHIASDGWSTSILIKELLAFYQAYTQSGAQIDGRSFSCPLTPLPVQYSDYAHWQRQWLTETTLDNQLDYWIKQLAHLPTVHSFPLDRPRKATRDYRGKHYVQQLDTNLSTRTQQFAQQQDVTLFMLLQAAFSSLLSRYSGDTDIVLGSPIANREQAEIAPLVGFFVNTLVLRSDLSDDPSFSQLLAQSKQVLLDAYEHQQVPFEKIVDELRPERSSNHSPLFQVMLVLQNNEQTDVALNDIDFELLRDGEIHAKFDMTLSVQDTPRGLELTWEYATALFDESRILGLAQHFERLLTEVIANPAQRISEIPLLSVSETQQLLHDWSYHQADTPMTQSLVAQFSATAQAHPESIAISFGEQQLSYRTLDQQSNQLAHGLRELLENSHKPTADELPNALIGVCLPRSIDLFVSVLAILKAGAAYVPFDASLPPEVIAKRLRATSPEMVIVNQDTAQWVDDEWHCLSLDSADATQHLATQPLSTPELNIQPTDLAYVLTTSGSTGEPKAIAMPHQALSNLIAAMKLDCPALNHAPRVLQFASIGFDMSFTDMGLAWLTQGEAGGELVLIDQALQLDVAAIAQLLADKAITVSNLPYSMLQALAQYCVEHSVQLPALKVLISTAEALKISQDIRAFFSAHSHTQLLNHFGPSETHVVTAATLRGECQTWPEIPSIGRPLANVRNYVLDATMQPVPVGVVGELYCGGAGLAQGYLYNAELTAEKFIADPFVSETPLATPDSLQKVSETAEQRSTEPRLYRTGDLVRWTQQGELEYLGRADQQVKLRGFRIELGEIETVLMQHATVREAVVVVNESAQQLIGYVVLNSAAEAAEISHTPQDHHSSQEHHSPQAQRRETAIHCADLQTTLATIKGLLGEQLPNYMQPAVLMPLDSLPLTTNGKVDKRALPAPDLSVLNTQEYVPPTSATEQALAVLWQDVLTLTRVGVTDNFFEIGGHSLLATKLVSKIRAQWDITFTIRDVFDHQTIRAMVPVIETANANDIPPMTVAPANALPVASWAQQRLWLVDQIDPGSTQYALPALTEILGAVDYNALQYVLDNLLARHQTLRTVYHEAERHQQQQAPESALTHLQPAAPLPFELIDLSDRSLEQREQALRDIVDNELDTPMDLTRDLMFRATLVKMTPEKHMLVATIHHIATDGWSTGVLNRDATELYNAYVENREPNLPDLPISYADYAHWQRGWLTEDRVASLTEFWKTALNGAPAVMNLPLDFPRSATPDHKGHMHKVRIDSALYQDVKALALSQNVTLFMLLHSALSYVLSCYSGDDDIVMGSPIANREQHEVSGLVGFFINMFVLRMKTSGAPSFADLLAQSKQYLLAAYQHQQMPFDVLVDELAHERSASYHPIYQVILALQNNDEGSLALNGLQVTPLAPETIKVKADLSLNVEETRDGLVLSWDYAQALFKPSSIARMAEHFVQLLRGVTQQPDQPLNPQWLLLPSEHKAVTAEFNPASQLDYGDALIHEVVAQYAQQQPTAIAVKCGDVALTFAQLDAKANQLARGITAQGILPGHFIGMFVSRNVHTVVTMLAILKAGAIYVPLDPHYPKSRTEYIVSDAQVKLLITESSLAERHPDCAQILMLDHFAWSAFDGSALPSIENQALANQASTPSYGAVRQQQLAYIIYTSGSTGNPKGVKVTHGNVIGLVSECGHAMQLTSNDEMGFLASVGFDLSIAEVFLPLCNGATVNVVTREQVLDLTEFGKVLTDCTVLHAVPALMSELLYFKAAHENSADYLPNVRCLLVGGDQVSRELILRMHAGFPEAMLIELYGPTECTVFSSCHIVSDFESQHDRSIIGSPVPHVQMYVMRDAEHLLPINVAGELCIAGNGVTQGYLNRDDLTAEKFMQAPESITASRCAALDNTAQKTPGNAQPSASQRMYRTGDLVRWLDDGRLEFLGRIDNQVKIRGFRVELGEIESVLRQHLQVLTAAVCVFRSPDRIAAYVVPEVEQTDAQQATLCDELHALCAASLPEYMQPDAMVCLAQLPLSANGKVDRKQLPEPLLNAGLGIDYVAPRNDTEAALCELWSQLLNVEQVGVHDNFFELGGHSLLATRLVTKLRTTFALDIRVKTVFSLQTPAQQADYVLTHQSGTERVKITSAPMDAPLALSFAQQRLWLIDRIDPNSAQYNMPSALRLTGYLNVDALKQSLTRIVQRHQVLRTRYVADINGDAQLQVCEVTELPVHRIDVSHLSGDAQQTALTQAIREEAHTAFDLSNDLMLRASLVHVNPDEHVLLVTMHHIASDGWSMGVMIKELSALYTAFSARKRVADSSSNEPIAEPLAPLAIQYSDFAHWQNQWLSGERLANQISYWRSRLSDIPVVHNLPTDFSRPPALSGNGEYYFQHIDAALTQQLNHFAQSQGATLFMVLHAAFSTLLSRHSGEQDIVIGSPVANREQAEVEDLVGFFVNTLVLRTELHDDPSFVELLARSRSDLLNAYDNQQVPFERLVDELKPERSLSHSPLFQVMLVLQNNETVAMQLPDLTLQPIVEGSSLAKYDITLVVQEGAVQDGATEDKTAQSEGGSANSTAESGLMLSWEFATDLFRSETIARMSGHFEQLLTSIVNSPNLPVSQLPMITAEERDHIVNQWNNTQVEYPTQLGMHQLFEAQVLRTPNAPAVLFQQDNISYQALNRRANGLAYCLQQQGVKPAQLIGICVERSIDMVVGLLAILKAGGAYVPLDPAYPLERKQRIIRKADVTLVIADTQNCADYMDDSTLTVMPVTSQPEAPEAVDLDSNPEFKGEGNDTAYVIFTSGSTGEPKGVEIAHHSAVNLVTLVNRNFTMSANDTILCITSVGFDLSVYDIFGALACGAKLVISTAGDELEPKRLLHLIETYGVTYWDSVPSTLKMVVDYIDMTQMPIQNHTLRLAFLSGDWIPTTLPQAAIQYFKALQVISLGGATEGTVWSNFYPITQDMSDFQSVPYGRPLDNNTFYILDKHLQPVPLGVAGELYIGGVGVAKSYYNDPEKTAAAYLPNPFHAERHPTMYRTGDMGRLNATEAGLPGQMQFLGRIDHQVKIRGFRVELGEIQHCLRRHEQVKDVLVIVHGEAQVICAYVVAEDADLPNKDAQFTDQLKVYLRQNLPEYMVPAVLIFLPALPLTPNGKVDRKSLPEPDLSAVINGHYEAPETETEQRLAVLWQTLLALPQLGVTDNFFDVGGNSLLATRLVAGIYREFDIELEIRTLFQSQTVREQAMMLDEQQNTQHLLDNLDDLTEEELEAQLALLEMEMETELEIEMEQEGEHKEHNA